MKIFITNNNYITWPKAMAELLANQGHQVIFIDNGSTWEPLLDWYENCPFEVRRERNIGPRAAHTKIRETEKEPFVMTDPDYDLSMVPEDWPEALMEGLRRQPGLPKCGLSFDMSRVPQENYAHEHKELLCPKDNPECGLMVTWGTVSEDGYFMNYPLDTSFAIYKPKIPFAIGGAMLTRPYTGLHLPFHLVLDPPADSTKIYVLIDDEIAYYHKNATASSNSQGHLAKIIAEYYRRKE
jgi:hypothetical protein